MHCFIEESTHSAMQSRPDHLSKQSRQRLRMLHAPELYMSALHGVAVKTPSVAAQRRSAVLTAGAKSGTPLIQRRQALVQLLLALEQHESVHWNFKTLRISLLASLSSCCRSSACTP